jgi:hypothetical protein
MAGDCVYLIFGYTKNSLSICREAAAFFNSRSRSDLFFSTKKAAPGGGFAEGISLRFATAATT